MNSAEKPTELLTCSKCNIPRFFYMAGSIEDKCPNCGYKEGCCNDEGQGLIYGEETKNEL